MVNIFKDISIEDKEAVDFYLVKYSSFCLSAFTFSSLVSWTSTYHYQWTVLNNTLLIHFILNDDDDGHLMQPIGKFPKSLQNKIIEYAKSLNYKLSIYGVSNTFISLHPEFVAHFERVEHRDMDNYIYDAEDLAKLEGRNYQAKRNLINQFEAHCNWTSESLSDSNISDCFEILSEIYKKDQETSSANLGQELEALEYVLNHFIELKEEGILIRIDGKPVAFSIYENLNPSTCVVHFEKAMREHKGLYQMINRETAKRIFGQGCKNINREEDLGIEGLRKAKLSYHPLKMCTANSLIYRG